MSTCDGVADSLGAYVLGALDEQETADVEAHLADCPDCAAEVAELSAMRDVLGKVPPEAFLDGPADDVLLQRTLRQVHAAKRTGTRNRNLVVAGVAVLAVAAALGGGVVLGKATEPPAPAALPAATGPNVLGTIHLRGAGQGAQLDVTVTPAGGWVKLNAWVAGIPTGQRCRLVVVTSSGQTEVAGSWLVSRRADGHGITLDGAALVAADQVRSVEVQDMSGRHTFVSASN
ncbi:MAG TPA: zf-HC2 domain-containing protein [Pseudonocardiaceae bacterium]|jgi:RNA polymerase sigma-70 factor (ECF subfamily)|nr:zf-HC2 domain-containing protein [Pseudonocardiaceae bacterium]